MSTEISYKGSVLTTVSNETKTLQTAGKYLEDDITVTDSGGSSTTVEALSVTQNGTYTAPAGTAYSPVTVSVSGGGGDASKPVKFIDYDGTLLYSYTAAELNDLSEMPANPSHTGLTAQGWNYTLAQAKAQVTATGEAVIGQMYVTDDDKTRIYCHFEDGRLSPYFGICPNGTVTVDWGDGSATSTLKGSSLTAVKSAQHIYATSGDYVITLTASTGTTFAFYGESGYYSCTLRAGTGSGTDAKNSNLAYVKAIKKIELGSAAKINAYAFYYCLNLSSAAIPSTATGIGDKAFVYCVNLSGIVMPPSVTTIETTAFSNCYSLSAASISHAVTKIGSYAFESCYNLSDIAIPSALTEIQNYAFQNCVSLPRISIPSTVASISQYSFSNCHSLHNLTIQSGVTSISQNSFANCYNLKSVTIPSTVTSIASSAFSYCYSLENVVILSGSSMSIGNSAFAKCYSLSNILIPSTVTSIGSNAFDSCKSLINATIQSGIATINASTFTSCFNLSSITIPSGVTSIASSAFSYCYTLVRVVIPSTVTQIEASAFAGCYGVSEYHIGATTPPTLANSNAFSNIPANCIIYVPYSEDHSILNAYKTASVWTNYATKMQEEPQ